MQQGGGGCLGGGFGGEGAGVEGHLPREEGEEGARHHVEELPAQLFLAQGGSICREVFFRKLIIFRDTLCSYNSLLYNLYSITLIHN